LPSWSLQEKRRDFVKLALNDTQIWAEPFTQLRLPKIYNLRMDPYERADITSNTYWDWIFDHAFVLVPAQDAVGNLLGTFKEFLPSQKTGSFSINKVVEQLQQGAGSK
jgi:arylsulfatase